MEKIIFFTLKSEHDKLVVLKEFTQSHFSEEDIKLLSSEICYSLPCNRKGDKYILATIDGQIRYCLKRLEFFNDYEIHEMSLEDKKLFNEKMNIYQEEIINMSQTKNDKIKENELSILYGYINHSKVGLLNSIEQICAFIFKYQSHSLVITDVADNFILNVEGGFIDRCADPTFLNEELLPTLIPIQMGETAAVTFEEIEVQ